MRCINAFFIFFFMVTSVTFAHAPSDIEIRYNGDIQTVEADIFHAVGDVSVHFVHKATIKHNDIVVDEVAYPAQDDRAMHTVSYELVEPRKNDVVEVSVECNWGGTLAKEIRLP